MDNRKLNKARQNKRNEFFTRLCDVENELNHYKDQFKGKSVLCNCDDPNRSSFFTYFHTHFRELGLKELVAVCYIEGTNGFYVRDNGEDIIRYECEGNGDFRSAECIELLQRADIVCTNPPFSLLKAYIEQLLSFEKRFLIIAHQHCFTYTSVFHAIKDRKMWLGYGFNRNVGYFTSDYDDYAVADEHKDGMIRVSGVCWLTNLGEERYSAPIPLTEEYRPELYPKYVNCDGIEVARTAKIPKDYYGLMGVPSTFLFKWCPDQFELVRLRYGDDGRDVRLKERNPYKRILIKRKH